MKPHAKTADAYLRTLGTDLATFIADRKAEGLSFARVAVALSQFTAGVVDVTGQTINNWARDLGLELEEVAS